MFKNLSSQTKSFIILFSLALVGTYVTTLLSLHSLGAEQSSYSTVYYPENTGQNSLIPTALASFMPPFEPVDTSTWKTYTDTKYAFSFQYAPGWKVLPGKQQNGFYVIQVDPGPKYYNMKIYVSPSQFYEIDGLSASQTTVNGMAAYDVSNLLYGLKVGQNYYTFDNGLSTKMIDNFNALVRSVKFQ